MTAQNEGDACRRIHHKAAFSAVGVQFIVIKRNKVFYICLF